MWCCDSDKERSYFRIQYENEYLNFYHAILLLKMIDIYKINVAVPCAHFRLEKKNLPKESLVSKNHPLKPNWKGLKRVLSD